MGGGGGGGGAVVCTTTGCTVGGGLAGMFGMGISAGHGSLYSGSLQQKPTWLVSMFKHAYLINTNIIG